MLEPKIEGVRRQVGLKWWQCIKTSHLSGPSYWILVDRIDYEQLLEEVSVVGISSMCFMDRSRLNLLYYS